MRRVQNLRVFVCTAGTLLFVISALPFAGAQQPPAPAAPQAAPARPTAPPPGAPARARVASAAVWLPK